MRFTIQDFQKRFPDDDSCLEELMQLRYGEVSACLECHRETKFHRVRGRRCYECQWCGFQVYPTQGTPFEKTTTPLSSWFYVIYLMTATRSGVAAKEIERQLGVTYKTAWRMCHQIRKLMGANLGEGKLFGHIEVDETYSGGVKKGKRGRGAAGKTPIFGMLEREGDVRAEVVSDVRRATLLPIIKENIAVGSQVSSDELRTYDAVASAGFEHGTVNHSHKQFVNGVYHTQGIEGFWSRLKLSVRGTHVHVSKKHLQKYADEFAFRHNNRAEPALMFDAALSSVKNSPPV